MVTNRDQDFVLSEIIVEPSILMINKILECFIRISCVICLSVISLSSDLELGVNGSN